MNNEIKEIKKELENINTKLNKAIVETETYEDVTRELLRKIRNQNIQTYLTIMELEMKEVL